MPNTNTPSNWSLFDQLRTAIVWLDEQLQVQHLNLAAEEMLLLSRKQARQRSLTELLPWPATLLNRLANLSESHPDFTAMDIALPLMQGERLLLDITASYQPNGLGTAGIVLELRRTDAQLRISREAELNHQQQAQQQWLRSLAHEIKNPLGGLRGAAQLLSKQLPTADLREYTQVIINEADRLAALVDRVLGPARVARMDSVNLHEVLEHVHTLLAADAGSRLQISTDYDPSIPNLHSHRDHLVQALLNIGRNALEAVTQPPGQLLLRSRSLRKFTIAQTVHRLVAHIQISDNGPGIPAELQTQIFFPLVSGRAGGSGLGLAISQSLITQLGGLLDFSSEPGCTQFNIYLPLEHSA